MGEGSQPFRVFLIANAHIDLAWLWRREEGRRVVLKTAREMVRLLEQVPDLTFSFSQVQAYQWLEEEDPALFDRVKELIRDGRWHVVGGMWVEPDCNLPAGESFARQLLYGQRYLRQKLGVQATVGYNVDSFGHAGTLPQLLLKGGLESYVFFRPDPQREAALDEDLFLWQAPDGSTVFACRPPNHYCSSGGGIEGWLLNAVAHAPERAGVSLCFFGFGDHGGGPTAENIASIRRLQEKLGSNSLCFGSLAQFFELARAARADYPIRRAELQHHSPGCYSAHSAIKRWNRWAEQELAAIEKAHAVMAALSGSSIAGTKAFEHLWRLVLFNQFHDVLAGTCIPEVYEDAERDYAEVRRIASGIRGSVLERLCSMTDTTGDGEAWFVFNPCAWARVAYLELEPEGQGAALGALAAPAQRLPGGKVLVQAEVPALGATVLQYSCQGAHCGAGRGARVAGMCLENEFLRLEVDPESGEWLSLFDKTNDVEVLAQPGNRLVVLDDPSDTWSHGVRGYHTAVGRFAGANVSILEEGPLRASLSVKRFFGRSCARERISLYAGSRVVEVEMTLDWHETRKAVKVSFPLALQYPVCTYEAPYGVAVRVPNGEEEPGQTWVDASGVARSRNGHVLLYGASLINDCKYGFDIKSYGGYDDVGAYADLRMTILRSAPFAFHDPRQFDPDETYQFLDQGEQQFRYWLLPHTGSWKDARTPQEAHALNAPLLVCRAKGLPGALPRSWSFLEAHPKGVEVSTLKMGEDGEWLVLRLWETLGRDCVARLTFGLWGCSLTVPLAHHEVKTLRLRKDGGRLLADELNLLEDTCTGGYQGEAEPHVRHGDHTEVDG